MSPREAEVLELVAQALSNSEIAARLHMTQATVKRHLRNAFVMNWPAGELAPRAG